MNYITFYDSSSLRNASFWLLSLYECKSAYNYSFHISRKIPSSLKKAMYCKNAALLSSICIFQSIQDGEAIYFCVDTGDDCDYFHHSLLKFVDVYFKVNYNREKIEKSLSLKPHIKKIVPIQQFFPVSLPINLFLNYQMLLGVGPWKKMGRQLANIKNGFYKPNELIKKRHMKKDIDIFFMTSFRDRHIERSNFRYKIIHELKNIPHLNLYVGLRNTGKFKSNPKYADVSIPSLNYSEYVQQIARSRIVIYTRGMHECISSRFLLYMSLGIPMVGEKIINNTEYYYSSSHLNEQLVFDNVEQIVATAAQLASDESKCEYLAKKNAEFFDQFLSPKCAGKYMLNYIGYSNKKNIGEYEYKKIFNTD